MFGWCPNWLPAALIMISNDSVITIIRHLLSRSPELLTVFKTAGPKAKKKTFSTQLRSSNRQTLVKPCYACASLQQPKLRFRHITCGTNFHPRNHGTNPQKDLVVVCL